MQLSAKELLATLDTELRQQRQKITRRPGLALVWVGDDHQTAAFVRVKQRKAQLLSSDFFLHHFSAVGERQLLATIAGLNQKKEIDGIVLQLPLPSSVKRQRVIDALSPEKDVDGLTTNSQFVPPTPTGIIELLKFNGVDLKKQKTVILGAGLLVGAPLADIFAKNKWPFIQITSQAEKKAEEIRSHSLLIACTGVLGLVTPAMVHKEMIVVDGSGVDVNVAQIEPLAKAVTPTKGAIGPLTVSYLFKNLLLATSST